MSTRLSVAYTNVLESANHTHVFECHEITFVSTPIKIPSFEPIQPYLSPHLVSCPSPQRIPQESIRVKKKEPKVSIKTRIHYYNRRRHQTFPFP